MRKRFVICWPGILLITGCSILPAAPDEPATQQVASTPFAEPRNTLVQTKVRYAPASQEMAERVDMIGRKLAGGNPQLGMSPAFIAISSTDPEIFHVGMTHVYVTETLIRQCQSDAQVAAMLAFELGRIVSEREAAVADQVRNPEPLRPIHLPIGGSYNSREADPMNYIELARHEKQYPRQPRKLVRPNPELIARNLMERGGYQRTELDAVMPILQNAERFNSVESQFKGTLKQSDWKQP